MLRGVSIVSGFVYLITQPWQPFPGSYLVKGLAVGSLALLAFLSGSPLLGLGLALSTVGDVLLDLDPERLFVFGLGAFLLAHLVYTAAFLRERRRPMAIAAGLVLLYSIGVSSWLLPSLGNLMLPVAIYMCAITAMVISAILARFSTPLVAIGAILFLISDSLLAINKFKTPVPYRDILVWSTYYIGQYSIAVGYLRSRTSV